MQGGKSEPSSQCKEDEMTLKEVLMTKRLNLDFTEMLWKVLKGSKLY